MTDENEPTSINEIPISRTPKYPWDQWTNGELWIVARGIHYSCTTAALRARLHQKANELRRLGENVEKVVTRQIPEEQEEGDKLAFQFIRTPPPPIYVPEQRNNHS